MAGSQHAEISNSVSYEDSPEITMPGIPCTMARSLYDDIRDSCAALDTDLVRLDTEAAQGLGNALGVDEVKDAVRNMRGCRFPVRFEGLEEEVNFMALLGLLHFGSGYHKEFYQLNGCDAYDAVTKGVLGMHLASEKLNTDGICSITIVEVGSYFSLPLQQDVGSPEELHPAITMSQPGGAPREMAELITRCLNDTGRILWERRMSSLGEFVLSELHQQVAPL
ncbi:hypothetical protein CYMTET_26418 [Cymbomonas tetramitiformis]|uniref:Queuosine salvage protein n=1 Tax=Cymbomonas tetramitiformis TaxID=36881 RepID=A0AAE0FRW2_9CHLO|nr:hypothetical protein CYMTET_26418 [Cymbomonas tetramitiformis]